MKILMVIDMQNDFLTGSLGSEAAEKIIPAVRDYILHFDGEVWATQDTHFPETYTDSLEAASCPVHCLAGTEGHEIEKSILDAVLDKKHKIYRKFTYGCTAAAKHLQDRAADTEEAEIVGVCTDICVVSNALLMRACCPDMKITVHKNLCAGTTEENHEAALKVMKSCGIDIID